MALPAHAANWMSRAEIDYIGPFVKAWAAFNAWYRPASGEALERAMLEYVKSQPNPVRRGILPLLNNQNETADALNLKQAVYDLHQSLDTIHFEVMRKGVKERISLRTVCIYPKSLQQEQLERRGQEFKAVKVQGGTIEITGKSLRTGQVWFQYTQAQYDPGTVYAQPSFTANLSEFKRTTLRQFYDGCNPRPACDLVQGDGPALTLAGMQFQCSAEDLLSGLVETIYTMRNALLHGEVDPDVQVLACYEPAYRIVMQLLACIR